MPFLFYDVLRAIWDLRKDPGFIVLALFAAVLIVGGTIFYWRVESLRPLNAFYFTMTTLTTVGYGDITPHTAAGKLFTAIFLICGIGIILALLASIAGQLQRKSVLHRPLTGLSARRAARHGNGGKVPAGRDLSAYGDFDVLVIGSNEASRETAVAAASAGLRVIVADEAWPEGEGQGR